MSRNRDFVSRLIELLGEYFPQPKDSMGNKIEEGFYRDTENNIPCYIHASEHSRGGWVREAGNLAASYEELSRASSKRLLPLTLGEARLLHRRLYADSSFLCCKLAQIDKKSQEGKL